jgi:hypothetical protein
MRILHVNDAAGVAVNLAKYQTRLGHTVCVVLRNQTLAGLHESVSYISAKHKHNLVYRTLDVFRFYCYVAAYGRRFDIIHIHTQYLVWFFLPFKHKILEFHGSDVRNFPSCRWAIDVAVTSIFLRLFREGLIH